MARIIPGLPHPSAPIVDQRGNCTREWYDKLDELVKALQQRITVTGTATFGGGTSVAVVFSTPEPNTSWGVHVDGGENKTFWITSKTTTGFTINASAASSATVGWTLVRR